MPDVTLVKHDTKKFKITLYLINLIESQLLANVNYLIKLIELIKI